MPGAALPAVDVAPRLLIDSRGKEGKSFEHNGHLKKLRELGVHVQVIDTDAMALEPRG